MTYTVGHLHLQHHHHAPSSPLTPTPLQTSVAIAIDTSAIASTRLLLHPSVAHNDGTARRHRRLHQSPRTAVRRARSHSPSRRSPKLRHTNGRLHSKAEAEDRVGSTTADQSNDLTMAAAAEAQREEELLVLESQSFPSTAVTGMAVDLSMFPLRNDVRRTSSCVESGDMATETDTGAGAGTISTQTQQRQDTELASPPSLCPPRRFKIFYRDEALRESCAKNTRRMIENAKCGRRYQQQQQGSPSTAATATTQDQVEAPLSNQQKLALKALKYRNLLDRMHQIDESRLNDPSFDVLECLGVTFCRV